MGLDMYLYAERYVGRWEHMKEDDRSRAQYEAATAILEHAGLEEVQEPNSGVHVRATAAYWRKANAIHAWFVDNVQGGSDDCRSYYVSREQLEELVALCERVLSVARLETGTLHTGTTYHTGGGTTVSTEEGTVVANPEEVEELLPVRSGFFFGSTAYNEWYISDVRRTVERVGLALRLTESAPVDFYYQSSW